MEERRHMKADTSKSNNLNFGTKTTTWKDIGVDLCAKKGGWKWAWTVFKRSEIPIYEAGGSKHFRRQPAEGILIAWYSILIYIYV